jgi:hypothetical protein
MLNQINKCKVKKRNDKNNCFILYFELINIK